MYIYTYTSICMYVCMYSCKGEHYNMIKKLIIPNGYV